MSKKKWEKPKLVVLVRGESEEKVLAFCKTAIGHYGSSPGNYHWGCHTVVPVCEGCSNITSS